MILISSSPETPKHSRLLASCANVSIAASDAPQAAPCFDIGVSSSFAVRVKNKISQSIFPSLSEVSGCHGPYSRCRGIEIQCVYSVKILCH